MGPPRLPLPAVVSDSGCEPLTSIHIHSDHTIGEAIMTIEIADWRTGAVHKPTHPSAEVLSDRHRVVVVGAGQAGLAVSRELGQAGVAHVVLERGRVAQAWRDRWDSFCLVTPNWSAQLPGGRVRRGGS